MPTMSRSEDKDMPYIYKYTAIKDTKKKLSLNLNQASSQCKVSKLRIIKDRNI